MALVLACKGSLTGTMGAERANTREPGGALPPGRKLGRYEVLAKLAAGGMAIVYVARAQGVAGFQRLVALKVLHANLAHEEEFISMFLDEARLAARIRHPNVVPTIDISDSPDTGFFLVMDYIEGDHLGQLLAGAHKAGERLPVPVGLRIVVDILGGLGAAHRLTDEHGKPLNLVHRDVSPHNIMVGRDGVSRLTDFGVAKAEDRLTHTRDGQVKGKLAYMAPEQASCGRSDARSDLFSVGILLWECLTGRRLFRGETTAATLHKLLHEEIVPPSSVDPALEPLDAVLMKALARDPADRYQDTEEFAQALEEAAVPIGGVASLRAVAKAVKQFASQKLKRDKQLIQDAINHVRTLDAGGVADPPEQTDPSLRSAVSISGASSLSVSKMSGVYANRTAPGVPLREQTLSSLSSAPKVVPGPLVAPPPVGSTPPVTSAPPPEASRPATARRRLGMAWGLGGLLVALPLVLWLGNSDPEQVQVSPIGPRPGTAMEAPQPVEPAAQPAAQSPAAPIEAPAPPPADPVEQDVRGEAVATGEGATVREPEAAASEPGEPAPEPPPRGPSSGVNGALAAPGGSPAASVASQPRRGAANRASPKPVTTPTRARPEPVEVPPPTDKPPLFENPYMK